MVVSVAKISQGFRLGLSVMYDIRLWALGPPLANFINSIPMIRLGHEEGYIMKVLHLDSTSDKPMAQNASVAWLFYKF